MSVPSGILPANNHANLLLKVCGEFRARVRHLTKDPISELKCAPSAMDCRLIQANPPAALRFDAGCATGVSAREARGAPAASFGELPLTGRKLFHYGLARLRREL